MPMESGPRAKPLYLPSFARARARGKGAKSKADTDRLLAAYEIILDEAGETICPSQWFGESGALKRYWCEIGFGAGEHLAFQASRNSDTGIIGCEPYLEGTASLLRKLKALPAHHVRLFRRDARLLLARLKPGSLEKIFVLFPDPWPKKRHHKRRIISPETLNLFAQALSPGGKVRLATDIPDYADWMLQRFLADTRFCWDARAAADWQTPPEDWIQTRYQQKAFREGRTHIAYLEFTKR